MVMRISASSNSVQMSHHGTNATGNGGGGSGAGGPSGFPGSAAADKKLPTMQVERPKMPRATWDALRQHILRERQRKKEKEKETQEEERKRREKERKHKQEALTLEETKEEISVTEVKLQQLKKEKHALFNELKKVLEEDTKRKAVNNPPPAQPTNHLYLQPTIRVNPAQAQYKPAQLLMPSGVSVQPAGSMKRTRSPTPPPQNTRAALYYRGQSQAAPQQQQQQQQQQKFASPSYSTGANSTSRITDQQRVYLTPQQQAELVQQARINAAANYAAAAVQQQQQQQQQQRAAVAALSSNPPPSAHGSAGSYARSYAPGRSSVTLSTTSASPRLQQQQQQQQQQPPQQPNGGTVRYYTSQREV